MSHVHLVKEMAEFHLAAFLSVFPGFVRAASLGTLEANRATVNAIDNTCAMTRRVKLSAVKKTCCSKIAQCSDI